MQAVLIDLLHPKYPLTQIPHKRQGRAHEPVTHFVRQVHPTSHIQRCPRPDVLGVFRGGKRGFDVVASCIAKRPDLVALDPDRLYVANMDVVVLEGDAARLDMQHFDCVDRDAHSAGRRAH